MCQTRKQMQILEINLARGWRGGERQTLYTAAELQAMGHAVTVVCRRGSALEEQCLLHELPVKAVSGGLELGQWLATAGSKYDILHCQGSKEMTWCALTRQMHGRPVVLSRRVNFKPGGALTAWKYRQAAAVVAVSPAIRETLHQFGVKEVEVIPSAFLPTAPDEKRMAALRAEFGVGNRKIIATVAALTPEKDPFTMVEAVRKLTARRQDFIFLHFGDGMLRSELVKKIEAAGLEEVYFPAGHRNHLEGLYPAFDVYAMSSTEEGLGSSVLDAFYHRVPVVSTNAGGLKNLMADGRGLLCATGDADCLAKGMEQLLEEKQEHSVRLDKAHDYLLAHHGITGCTRQYENLFHRITARSGKLS